LITNYTKFGIVSQGNYANCGIVLYYDIKLFMRMMTTQEAADELGVSVRRITELIRTGRLPSERFGKAHAIREEDLELVRDRKPGRPPKKESARKDKNVEPEDDKAAIWEVIIERLKVDASTVLKVRKAMLDNSKASEIVRKTGLKPKLVNSIIELFNELNDSDSEPKTKA
jgi:excisionase family DNA binding protein